MYSWNVNVLYTIYFCYIMYAYSPAGTLLEYYITWINMKINPVFLYSLEVKLF